MADLLPGGRTPHKDDPRWIEDGSARIRETMLHAGIGGAAIEAFDHQYRSLAGGATGMVCERDIVPHDMDALRDQTVPRLVATAAIATTAVLQNRVPKLRLDDLTPVRWPPDPALEWCPPGHGDLYAVLHATGLLDLLLEAGCTQAFVSNSDNLGALPDPRVAGWFAPSGAPFAIEAVRRTASDRKGGHFALRRRDGRIILRLHHRRGALQLPLIDLGAAYMHVDRFEARFPHGVPSLAEATSLTVHGDWTFGGGVRVVGDVELGAGHGTIAAGTVLGPHRDLPAGLDHPGHP